jgi:hypothetical protein
MRFTPALLLISCCIAILSCSEESANQENNSAESTEENLSIDPVKDLEYTADSMIKVDLSNVPKQKGGDTSNLAHTSFLPDENASTEEIIASIKMKYNLIMLGVSEDKYATKTISYDCVDYPEYGQVTYYSAGEDIVLIKHQADDGSHWGGETQYFFLNNELFFVYEAGSYWTFAEGSTADYPTSEDHGTEERYYFHYNKLVKCLYKEFVVSEEQNYEEIAQHTSNQELACSESDAKEILEQSDLLLSLFGKKGDVFNCIYE